MRMLDSYGFPENAEEANAWKETIRVKALARQVLAVAITRPEGTWRAYCDAVPGQNHDYEWRAVREHGCTLLRGVAEAIFPEFTDIPYAR